MIRERVHLKLTDGILIQGMDFVNCSSSVDVGEMKIDLILNQTAKKPVMLLSNLLVRVCLPF